MSNVSETDRETIDRVWRKGVARRRRRRLWMSLPSVAIVATGFAVFAADTGNDPGENPLAAVTPEGSPETTQLPATSTTSTTIDDAPPVSVNAPTATIDIEVPTEWSVAHEAVYVPIGTGANVTVSSHAFRAEPSRNCNIPVAALSSIGVDGAVFSVVEVGPEQGSNRTRPSLEEFLTLEPDDGLHPRCLDESVPAFRLGVFEFTEVGRYFLAYVALGSDASPDTIGALESVIQSLRIEPL
ncbi:MAG: hypothetical protein ACT4OX_06640 [Actinomycetota bacterium]